MLTFGNKVENGGTTPQGILTAEEFNALVKQVNANSQRAGGSVSGIIINGETATPNKDGYIEIKALNDALAKLDNIEDGSQANKIEKIAVNGAVQPIEGKTALLSVPQRVSELTNDAGYVRNRDISATLTDIQDRIVDLEGREEVSAEQLEKIDSVEAGAQVNVLESVIFNGAVLPVVNKEVSINIDLSRKADLDENGKVLASQMPSYVDDVLDAYAEYDMTESGQPINIRLFEDEAKTNPIKPESQKIYLDKESKYQYRWTGTEYATIGAPTVIGEVAGTAYDGSKGKALSDAFNAHASNIDNPHQVTKGQVGLGNVDNTADKDKNVNSAIKDGSGNVISETYATLEALGAAGDIVDGVIESVSALNEFAESAADSINQLSTNKADKSEVASLAETVHGNTSAIETMEETANSISENLSGHTGDYSNPHQVTKSQIGLGNVNNTADKDKNVNSAIKDGDGNVIAETYQTLSTSQQIVTQLESDISNNLNEINTLKSDKANKADLEALSEDVSEHISDLDNPHQVTKGQVGLSNVDNTADKDKPVSSVQQAALDKKADKTTVSALSESVSDNSAAIDALDASISSLSENKADKTALNKLITDTTTALDKKVDKVSGMGLSTNDYTDEDKAKLDGIEEHANNYSLPVAGAALGGVKSGEDITIQPDGTMQVKDDSHNHIISNVDGLQSALDKKRNGLVRSLKHSSNQTFDWNDIVTPGSYTIDQIGTLAPNAPRTGGYGTLVVEISGDRVAQIYYPDSQKGYIYLCVRVKVGTAWRDWQYYTTLNHIDETYATKTENNNKVDKVSGKGLSTNDYTTADKDKLAGVAAGAEVNTIVAVQRNGTAITPTNRVVNILVPVKTSELNNDSTYQTAADVAETIVGVKLDLASGIITLTRKNGTTFTLDLPTEKIIKSGRYDSETEEIVLVLEDESEIRFSASELIDEYYADESTLELYTDTADGNKKKFRIKTAYKNKIDGSEQTTNKTASVSASSTDTQYPNAKAVYNAVKDLATKVQTFSQASTRSNIESGETISTIFGKSRKWFSDLKAVAFSGSYNDLSDTPELPTIATSTKAGLVKSGGDITVDASGNVSVNKSAKATHDGSGNNIATSYLKLAGGNMTGNIRKKEGDYVALIPSKQYPSNYLQFMKITYVGASFDVPIEIRLSGRGSHRYVIQVNNSTGGPSDVTFYATGDYISSGMGVFYRYDSTTKTLALMYHRAGGGGWEAAAITDVIVPNNHHDKFTFDYAITEVASTSGWTKAGMTTFHYAISELAKGDGNGNNIANTYLKKSQYSFAKNYSINGSGWYLIGYLQTNTENTASYRAGTITLTMYSLITQEHPLRVGTLTYAVSANYDNPQIRISDSLLPFLTTRWDNVTKRVEIWGYGEKAYSGFLLVFDSAAASDYFVLNPDTITELKNTVEGQPIYQFKTCLELTDSNLATYFANGVLTIPNGVTTVIFNTTAVKTVYLVQGTVQTNGYRLTIGGKWQPDTNSDYQGLEGCFPYYVDYHYYGYAGSSLPNFDAYSHFADYVYFNGMWFSKMY